MVLCYLMDPRKIREAVTGKVGIDVADYSLSYYERRTVVNLFIVDIYRDLISTVGTHYSYTKSSIGVYGERRDTNDLCVFIFGSIHIDPSYQIEGSTGAARPSSFMNR